MNRAGGERLERRRSLRVSAAPVSVVGARLVNVSPTGMRIESSVRMELWAVHRFRLVITGVKVDVEARVVACSPRRQGGRRTYAVGLDFLPGHPRDRLARALAQEAEREHP